MRHIIHISLICILSINCDRDNQGWTYLFDGKSLNGWEMKIAGYELNNNYRNTFSVKDGAIRVSYKDYDSFDERFGHIFFTKNKFKNYHLKMDYRFYGEHANSFKTKMKHGTTRTIGVMLHSEDPSKMSLDQEFPVSIEAQFLGGSGLKDRPTLNMCSLGMRLILMDLKPRNIVFPQIPKHIIMKIGLVLNLLFTQIPLFTM